MRAGAGAPAAAGRLARGPLLWDGALGAPAWAPPRAPPRAALACPRAAVVAELARSGALERLRALFAREFASAGGAGGEGEDGAQAPPLLAFERWRFACKAAEEGRCGAGGRPADPLLPAGLAAEEPGLVADLERAGLRRSSALAVTGALARAAAEESRKVQRLVHRLRSGGKDWGKRGGEGGRGGNGGGATGAVEAAFHQHSIDLTARGHPQLLAKLSYVAYGKLAELHRRNAPAGEPTAVTAEGKEQAGGAPAAAGTEREMWEREGRAAASGAPAAGREALHERMFAMLLRYKCIRGHGFQMAVGPAVFGVLASWLGTGMELFASPLNCHWGRFCSAFPDVDGPFGSAGSAFGFAPRTGSFEANPPFTLDVIARTADRALAALEVAEQAGLALSYAVFLPGWQEADGWQRLRGAELLEAFVLVAAADHGYCDGASHQRRDPFRGAQYDTGVFVLRTSKARRRLPLRAGFEEALRAAMAAAIPSEAAADRARKERGGARSVGVET